ncbi:putative sulfite oxidase, mitochondrial [Lachnellula hyalina]|uniref:Nitrate reductase [NADPH] n=1 Tax=Lachnellula hyalina TaxID=1316788 RepID=A0A8H8R1H2_9HELO|nr:putative sulfite oxidase, mitochondrial [Lachnellula hyalina]TVY26654.1 putative sulfite oxidase, mitochondrial [Lachnellula hyalina]
MEAGEDTSRVTISSSWAGASEDLLYQCRPRPADLRYAEAPPDQGSKEDDQPQRRIRLDEVKEHGPDSESPWVVRGQSVYDITDWVAGHPGGEVILRAAGGSVEPYWKIFSIHQKQEVYDILEQYRIGCVDERDLVDGQVPADSIIDPFIDDPRRDKKLVVLSARPCNAETPGDELRGFITPNRLFYVRNHMWVPTIEEEQYRLTIELDDGEEKTYTLMDLREKFPSVTITSTMQCSGNRRKHMTEKCGSTNGLQWSVGAIGNATWTGVRLRDVLVDAGFPIDAPPADAKHAQFTGLEAYGASVPLSKAIDAHGDVLLAYEMNGLGIPRDHGFPLRVIVPGHVAARSVKWLQKITISDEESLSQWQRRDYKSFGPNEGSKPDWSQARSIQEMPVTSAITSITTAPLAPKPKPQASSEEKKDSDFVVVEGYAYSGGGREIIRVDISKDDGKTWDQAELVQAENRGSKVWCWKQWRYQIPAAEFRGCVLAVKATDEAYNTQPETHDSTYNVRGNLATAWHRVKV